LQRKPTASEFDANSEFKISSGFLNRSERAEDISRWCQPPVKAPYGFRALKGRDSLSQRIALGIETIKPSSPEEIA